FLADGTLVANWRLAGLHCLGIVEGGNARALVLPHESFGHLALTGLGVLAVAGGPAVAPELVRIGVKEGRVDVLRRSRQAVLAPEWISRGEPFTFPTGGAGSGEVAHGVYYAPNNPQFHGPRGERAPLIVMSHGGPTGSASRVLDLRVQYWTTRGFGVADIDYRGSTGYGRDYRRALEGRWGLADVADCAAAANWLSAAGEAEHGRMVIRGSSASGLTVLAALARHDVFAAGTVLYGVADLASLAAGTHKFESHYISRLVPEAEYAARSPLHLAGRIGVPVLFLHGLDDRVAPPEQSRAMARALAESGLRPVLVEVEGESHGFRRATTLARAQEAELAFYGEELGFEPAGDIARAHSDLEAGRRPGGTLWS
ncbi:MAG TPA: prolyl oligopeptidase family serine peptidase, partial [Acidimicrobiales bacterium]|nr:prolyl oligopeptidase family serine peptidase [Acidimicrobiales bacterium]